VLDYCDSLALELSRRVQYQRSWRRLLYQIEARRMAGYERQVALEYDRVIAISPVDAESISRQVPVDVLVNSVRPGRLVAPESKRPLSIVFSGYVGFYSDELALLWFMQHVFPRVVERVPGVRLHIVGANPSARLKAMASERVIVTGYVDDLKKYVSECMVSVSPMQVGAGLKNKILEAMAHGVPVVTTSLGNQGVRATDGESILVADDPEEFADAVVRILSDEALRDRIGRGGHKLIEAAFSDEVVRKDLMAIYARAREAAAVGGGRGTEVPTGGMHGPSERR
jgi:glycosyltransferase involved in cell wall biosynthesis